jgi:hypothetical protein
MNPLFALATPKIADGKGGFETSDFTNSMFREVDGL